MQKISFLLFLIVTGITSFSQQEFFIYFQADNHQPFYARINSRMYSSTENGYMIIPKLGDSVYVITIGFAKNAFPEQSFMVPVNKKDRGFQLKNLGEKGWSLIDLQNMSVIPNNGLPAKQVPEFSGTRKTDAFSEMLASVVNDSSILYSAVKPKLPEPVPQKPVEVVTKPAEQEKKMKDSVQVPVEVAVAKPVAKEPVKKSDTVAKKVDSLIEITAIQKQEDPKLTITKTKDSSPNIPIVKNTDTAKATESVTANKPTVEKPFITRIDEKKTGNSYQATFLEQYILSTDTIKISIPLADSPATAIVSKPAPQVEKKVEEPAPIQKPVTAESTAPAKPITIDSAAAQKRVIQITNSDCVNLATDYDVDKLRVKLLNDKTIDDKLATSKKYFKTKCFSVKQIKALTELFPTDETKYQFFDTAYPFVSDTSNFEQLGELIETDYYKNRFKAMIHK